MLLNITLMKNKLLIVLVFLSVNTIAQTTISGHLKDNKGKPIIAASVTVKDSYDGTVSDSSGNFSFTTTEKGTHAITIIHNDFDDYETPVELDGQPLTLNILLKPKFNELKEEIAALKK